MKKSRQWNVSGAVRLSSVFHFLHSCASGCLLPFLTLHFRHLGLSAGAVGIIMASKHALSLAWRPCSSILARRYDKRRAVIISSLFTSALVVLTLLLFPSGDVRVESGRCNSSQPDADPTSPLDHITLPMDQSFSTEDPINASTLSSNWSSRSLQSLPKDEDPRSEFLGSLKVMDAQHQMFFLLLIITCLWEFTSSPIEWTADDGLHEYLDFVDATDRHSGVKMWRNLGFAFGNCLIGILVTSLFCLTGTKLEFYSYTILMILSIPIAALLPIYIRKQERLSSGGFKALQLIYGNPNAILCAVTVILMGMANSLVSDFILWQIQDCGGTEIHMGISLSLVYLSQIAFAPLAGRLSRFLKFHGLLLVLSVACLALQCLYYSFVWSPWAIIPAQFLAGVSNGALWWAVASQSEDIATPGTEKSILRLFEALFLEMGGAFGSVMAGFVVEKFGINVLFQGTAVVLAIWSSIVAVLKFKIPRQRRINYSRLLAADTEMSESESEPEKDWLETAMEESGRNNNKWTMNK